MFKNLKKNKGLGIDEGSMSLLIPVSFKSITQINFLRRTISMKTIFAFASVLLTISFALSLSLTVVADDSGFVPLITPQPAGISWTENGKPSNGWEKRGGEATFTVEGDSIVGKRGTGLRRQQLQS
jgi:hypothetical protein